MPGNSFTPELMAYYYSHADDNRQPNLIAAGVVGLVVAITAVIARFIARMRTTARFGWDDWLILVSLLPLAGYAGCMFYGVSVGDGRHIIFVTDSVGYVKAYLAEIIFYSTAICLIKCSILIFYHRIFPSKTLLMLSYIMGAIVIAYNLAICLVALLQCQPLSMLWNFAAAQNACIDTTTPYAIIAVVNVVTDFLILALPVRHVWKLQMKTARKLQVLVMFLLGTIVCVFGVIRVWAVVTIVPVDQSWNDFTPEVWTFVEISVGVVAACLPTLGMLLKRSSGKGSSGGKSSSNQTYGSSGRSRGKISSPRTIDQSDVQLSRFGDGTTSAGWSRFSNELDGDRRVLVEKKI